MVSLLLKHEGGEICVNELENGKRSISIRTRNSAYVPRKACLTKYSIELIQDIYANKGLWLCDEIMREEDPTYVQQDLLFSLMSYLESCRFEGKRILDFGCGCGASTMILVRMFPGCSVVGIDFQQKDLDVARQRLDFYGYTNVTFFCSPSSGHLPEGIGRYDYIVLSGVYEHLLPEERLALLPMIWRKLSSNGILFVNQTPDKRFPIEAHTSSLPLINYLPSKWVCYLIQKFSRQNLRNESWNALLRRGIRGATDKEILMILGNNSFASEKPIILQPSLLGMRRQSDIWYSVALGRLTVRYKGFKKYFLLSLFNLILKLKIPLAPYLSLAFRKTSVCQD